MQTRALFVVAFLVVSNTAALAESGSACQSAPRPQANSCRTAAFPGTMRSEGPFALARGLCQRKPPLCTGAINYSTWQQWASNQ